jgi:hypothetical protein
MARTRVSDEDKVPTADGYIQRYYGDLGYYQYVHIYNWTQEHGKVPTGYVVHHKDGNKRNNEVWNLGLVLRSIHTKNHEPWKHRKSWKAKRGLCETALLSTRTV